MIARGDTQKERTAVLTAVLRSKSGRGWDRKGFDTVAFNWPDQGGTKLLSAIQSREHFPMARGLVLAEPLACGARVSAWPEFGVVKLECRLGALIDNSRESHRLGTRDDMRAGASAAVDQLREHLGHVPDTKAVGVSRMDLVTERDFEQPADGLQLLRAMKALCPPGYKVRAHSCPDGRVETVAIVTPKRGATIFRAYDKASESGQGEPGTRVRLEAQVRRNRSSRQGPNTVASSNLAAVFGRTMEPFLKGEAVTVCHPTNVVDHVAAQISDGTMTVARGERLVGSAELLRRFGRGLYADDRQSARRLAALRDAGVAVDEDLPLGARIPVSQLLASAVEEWAGP